MRQKRFRVRPSQRILLATLFLAFMTPFAFAQGIGGLGGGASSGGGLNSTGGGGSGGGGNNATGTGTSGTIGTSTPIGSGNISALTNGTGLSSLTNTTSGKGGNTNASGTATIPVTSDPFNSFYINPYASGIIGSTTSTGFGQAVYPITAATTTSTSTIQTYRASTATGYSTAGTRRAPAYVTGAGEDLPLIRHNPIQLRGELQQILARSSSLKSKDNIRVEVLEGAVVRLTGTVASAHDQRLAEGLIRMTPGVQNVQNNLVVSQQVGLNR